MQLSYMSRVICFALCSVGLLQIALEFAASAAAPLLLRKSLGRSARETERSLLLLALFARFMPWLLVFAFLLPTYVRDEDNGSAEHVAIVCMALAVAVIVWLLVSLARTVRLFYRAHRCLRLCHPLGCTPEGSPLLLWEGNHLLMAIAGVFSSSVIVSRSLLNTDRFAPAALEVAFAHESSHAHHRDNLKLFILSALPHIPLAAGGQSLTRRWRLAAEIAADEEGTCGNPERALLLAELLVAVARGGSPVVAEGLMTLSSESESLHVRVERLLGLAPSSASSEEQGNAASGRLPSAFVLACGATIVAILCCASNMLGHRFAELLFAMG